MGLSACKAAANQFAVIGILSSGAMIDGLEFVMSTNEWDILSDTEKADIVERAMAADDALARHCNEFCRDYEKIMKDIDKAMRRDS